jgi:hypothetical protein
MALRADPPLAVLDWLADLRKATFVAVIRKIIHVKCVASCSYTWNEIRLNIFPVSFLFFFMRPLFQSPIAQPMSWKNHYIYFSSNIDWKVPFFFSFKISY